MHAPTTSRWRWLAGSAIALAAALPAPASAATQTQIDDAVSAGAAWIADQQDRTSTGAVNPSPTGSLPGFNGNWAVNSLAAAGIHAADVRKPGVPKTLQQHVLDSYPSTWGTLPNTNSPGNVGRETLIATAAGIPVTTISPTINLTASLASRWRPDTGSFGSFAPNSDGFALLAADGLHLPDGVRRKIDANLRAAQKTVDGGWSFSPASTGAGDIDLTGAVLSMLCQNGATTADPAVARGVAFLHGRLNPQTGGFGTTTVFGIPPSNAPGSSWALLGLKTCDVDPQAAEWTTPNGKNPVQALLDLQRPNGSFRYVLTTGEVAGGTDMNATEAAVRALASDRWLAPAPVRANPADPRLRPAPTVADGTPVPIALSVDPGDGDVRFCAVTVPSGIPLTTVLETARTASVPAGCVDDWAADGSAITTVNSRTPTDGARWQVRFAGGTPAKAADQAVGVGDVVALELAASPPSDPDPEPEPEPEPTAPPTTPGSPSDHGPTNPAADPPSPNPDNAAAPAGVSSAKTVAPPARKPAAKRKTQVAAVTCRTTGRRALRVTCTLRAADRHQRERSVRLTRLGRTYASGSLRAKRTTLTLRATRKVTRNRYTLRIGTGKRAIKLAVRIR